MKPRSLSATAEFTGDPLAAPKASGAPRGALVGLSLAMAMPSLATSIANAALPVLARTFDASFQAAQWIILAFLLTVTATIMIAGRLSDLIGRRRFLLAGIALFTIASLLCGLSPTLQLLVIARGAQGLGAAIMMTLTIAFVGDVVPKEQAGRAMGLLGSMSAIGTTLGPSLGGLLVAYLGWRAIFLVNLPLGVAAFVLLRRALPADSWSKSRGRADFDLVGMTLLLITLGAFALAMTIGHGRFGSVNFVLLVGAIGAGVCFLLNEARAASPLVRLSLLANPVLSVGLVTSALVSTVMMTTLVVGPFYLSGALMLDAAMVGIILSIGPFMAALTGLPAGALVDRFGENRVGMAGLAVMLAGSLGLCLTHHPGLANYVLSIIGMTGGYAVFQAANNTAVMANAPPAYRGSVSGMLSLSRNLGLVTGASVIGAIFAAAVVTDVVTAPPDAIAAGLRMSFTVVSFLSGIALSITTIRAWGGPFDDRARSG